MAPEIDSNEGKGNAIQREEMQLILIHQSFDRVWRRNFRETGYISAEINLRRRKYVHRFGIEEFKGDEIFLMNLDLRIMKPLTQICACNFDEETTLEILSVFLQ